MACYQAFTDLRIGVWDYKTCCPPWLNAQNAIYGTEGKTHHKAMYDSPWEVWNNKLFVRLREAILNGNYARSCSTCNRLAVGKVEKTTESWMKPVMEQPPRYLIFEHDLTCQLACPSCRPEIHKRQKWQAQRDEKAIEIAKEFIPTARRLNILQSGDPFASPSSRAILQYINDNSFPDLLLEVFTNGLSMPTLWPKFPGCHDNLEWLFFSIDAATKNTYEDVRRPGKWDQLRDALDYVVDLKSKFDFKIQYNFVVQMANYTEIPKFIKFARDHGADRIHFARILWSYSGINIPWKDVCDPEHHKHEELVEILNDCPELKEPSIEYGTLWHLIDGLKDQLIKCG